MGSIDSAFLSAASSLVGTNTVTETGNLAAVEVLESLCSHFGFAARRLESSDSRERDANLLIGPFGGDGASLDPLVLVTHLDTVDPGPRERWRTDPFGLHIEGEKAFGLGVADVKLDILCKLWAAHRLGGARLQRPFYILGTYGEEAGLRGARSFMASPPFRPYAVLCGEPSELIPCHAHKGYVVVRARVRCRHRESAGGEVLVGWEGKAAHSSTPRLGQNAIDLALDDLSARGAPAVFWISGGVSANTIPASCEAVVGDFAPSRRIPAKRLSRSLPTPELWTDVSTELPALLRVREAWKRTVGAIEPTSDSRFDPPEAVANLTRIKTDANAVEMTLDARLLPEHDPVALIAAFRAEVASKESGQIVVEVDRQASGMSLPESHPFVLAVREALASCGLDAAPRAKPTSTEAGVFARAGIPALVFGPSRSTGNAHCANEEADLSQVAWAIDAYEAIIRRVCGTR